MLHSNVVKYEKVGKKDKERSQEWVVNTGSAGVSFREDLLSILVQVNNEVSRANANLEDGLYKQTPAPLVTLRKKLYFL